MKSKSHKHSLVNLFTEQCSLKGSCTNRLNCHQALICICTNIYKRNSGFEQWACKVHFPSQMPVPLLKSVLTCKSKEFTWTGLSHNYFTAPPLRLSGYCHSGNNTNTCFHMPCYQQVKFCLKIKTSPTTPSSKYMPEADALQIPNGINLL